MTKKEYLESVMRKLEKRGLSGDELEREMKKIESDYKEEVSPMQAVLDKYKLIVQLQTEVHNLKDENRTLREELREIGKTTEPKGDEIILEVPKKDFDDIKNELDKKPFCNTCDSLGRKHKKGCPTLNA